MPGWKSLIPATGEWLTGPPHALEDLGPVPYGYVKYRTPFTFNGEPRMFISTRADDAKKVFVNGKFVAEASNTEKLMDFPLAKYAQPGSNLVEISYELFGAPNFGENLGELKGLESAGIGADFASAKGLESWQIQRYAALMRGREINSATRRRCGRPRRSSAAGKANPLFLPSRGAARNSHCPRPMRLGKYPGSSPSTPTATLSFFSMENSWGATSPSARRRISIFPNRIFPRAARTLLTFLLAYTDQPQHLRKLQVAPYAEFSVRRTRVEFEW